MLARDRQSLRTSKKYAVQMCRPDWRLRGSVTAPNAMHEAVLQSRPEMLSRLHLSSAEAF